MSINKLFYKDGTPKNLTFVLSNKGLNKLHIINNVSDVVIHPNFNSADEASLTVRKKLNDKITNGWDELIDLKVVYVPEIDEYFEARISISDSIETTKSITLTSLCEAELSQINLYNIEINTESDILRDEYTVPTVFYKESDPSNSLLHRILEKAPHYQIGHVDISLMNIQRSFSIDGTSIYDFLTATLADEIKCIFIFDSTTRTINVYDMLSYCHDCENRDEFTNACTKCGSTNISLPYGTDSGIFISKENLAQEISVETNADQLKNCFKLKGGDELMTATIRSINPNGSDYIYDFSDEIKNDMPNELVVKLGEYDKEYDNVIKNYKPKFEDTEIISKYNVLVDKYNDEKYAQYKYNDDDEKVLSNNSYKKIDDKVIGYSNLVNIYYDLVDFNLYLESSLLPTVKDFDHTAANEIDKLTADAFDGIGLQTCTPSTSTQTVESAIKTFTRVLVVGNFKVTVNTMAWDYYGTDEDGYNYGIWSGTVALQSYKDEEDIATSEEMTIKIWDNYQYYIEQKIKKALKDYDEEYGSIYDIYKIEYTEHDVEFKSALKYYSIARLNSFNDAYQSALDILIEIDQASEGADLYTVFYLPYYNRQRSINAELELRTNEVNIIDEITSLIDKVKEEIQEHLDLKNYLGIELWKTFNAYRREDVYENSNYISDGLDNAKLINRANEFIEVAKKELYKASRTQYTLTSTITNFMMMEEFLSLRDNFELGNWIRLKANGKVYKLRLLSFELNYEDLSNIPLTFSTLSQVPGDLAEIQSIINTAKDMSTKFSYIEQQAEQSKNTSEVVDNWLNKGFDATLKFVNDADKQTVVYDRNGLLIRSYDDIENKYEPTQMKLTNSTLAITDDNWLTVKTALGKYYYTDPVTNENKSAYGLLAETIVGQLIIGESLGIYNKDNTLSFSDDGLILNTISNGKVKNIFKIMKDNNDMISVDSDGNLVLSPDVKLQWRSSNGEIGEVDSTLSQIILDADKFKIEVGETYATQDTVLGIEGKFDSYYTKVETNSQIEQMADKINLGVEQTYTKKEDFNEAYDSQVEESIPQYYLSTSLTSPEGGNWQDNSPSYTEGKYIWFRIKTTYKSGSVIYSSEACISGNKGDNAYFHVRYSRNSNGNPMTSNSENAIYMGVCSSLTDVPPENYTAYTWIKIKGEDGKDGTDGSDGVSIDDIVDYYLVSPNVSGITISSQGWQSTNPPAMTAIDKYLWNYEQQIFSNGNKKNTTPKIIGVFGADGKGVKNSTVSYQSSSSGTIVPTGTWTTTIPTLQENQFLWTKFELTYSDDTKSASYTISRNPSDGADGLDGKGILNTSVAYQKSKSGTTVPEGAWSPTIISVGESEFLWTRTRLSYTDQSYTDSYSVGMMGKNGADGVSVENIVNYYLVNNLTSGVTINKDGWTTEVQHVTSANKYLWNYEKQILSNGTEINSMPCIIGAYGDKGDKGEDGITPVYVMIQNEAITFIANSAGIANATTRSNAITAYKGSTKVATTIGAITGLPTGMTISIVNNGSTNTSLTIAVTTSMKTESGVVNIPITADGVTQTKSFSYSLSKAGANGENAKVADIAATTQVFKCLADKTTYTPNTIVLTPQLQNCTYSKWQYSVNGGSTWIDVNNNANGLTIGTVNNIANCLTIANTSPLFTSTVTSIVFKLVTTATNASDIMTITRLSDGNTGADGVGIDNVKLYYYLSTSNTTQSGGSWSTTSPAWQSGKYIWTKQRTTLDNNTYTETDPVCISGKDGLGIKSVSPEYYLSTSSTTQIGGSWSGNTVAWVSGKYIWTRQKVVYSDDTIGYTTPIRDNSLDNINNQIETVVKNQSDFNIALNNITGRVTETEKQTTTINGSITDITERVTEAEEKLTAEQWSVWFTETVNNSGAVSAKFTMDRSGLHILNGGMDIKNNKGEKVLYADTDGNLTIENLTAVNGSFSGYLYGDSGAIGGLIIDPSGLAVVTSYLDEVADGMFINGTLIFEITGNATGETKYTNIMSWEVTDEKGNIVYKGGLTPSLIQVDNVATGSVNTTSILTTYSNTEYLNVNDSAHFYSSMQFDTINTGVFFKNGSYIFDSTTPYFNLSGSNDIFFSSNKLNKSQIIIHSSFIDMWDGLRINGYLDVTGAKHRVVETDDYGSVLMNAVESTNCLFEDNGSGQLNDNGTCVIFFDNIFAETINLKCEYYVQLTKCGQGDIYVLDKGYDYFVVKGTPNLSFDWNVKAKQIGYENDRLNIGEGYVSPEGGASMINEQDLLELRNKESKQIEEIDSFYDTYMNNLLYGGQ